MEISRLFNKAESEEKPEQFLAVQIQEGVVQTAVWQVVNGSAEIAAFGSSQNWDDGESLVMATDASLSDACRNLEAEPERVILGLPEYWIENDKISPEHSAKVKSILEKLELKPVGFVTTTEAVLQFLRQSEGIPPSVVIVELGKTRIGVVVTHLGQILGREEVGRSSDLAADVEEGLARINADQLPSRILIIDGVDPEAQQMLASYSWQEKLPFLHLPKVESLGAEFSVKAVALAGGVEAARSIGIPLEEETAAPNVPNPEPEPEPITLEEAPALALEGAMPLEDADFGFIANKDIRKVEDDPAPDLVAEPVPETPEHHPKGPQLKETFSNLKDKLPHMPKLPRLGGRMSPAKLGLIIFGFLFLALAGVTAAYFATNKARIVVEVSGQSLTKSVDIAIGDAKDSGLPSIEAQTETVSLEKSDSAPTTGEAVVGDRATGEMTIYNKTDTVRSLAAGTVLTTTNSLRFTLNEAVTVASRSAEETTGGQNITFGQATVKATATRIGAEYNIAANTSLSVADYPKSSLEAKNSKEFTGGSSRTVKAVSKKDREDLLKKLTDLIKQEAAAAQEAKASGEFKTIPVGDLEITSQTFDKGVDEEGEVLNLTLKAEVTLLRLPTAKLQELAKTLLASEVPAGFEIDQQKVNVTVESVEENKAGVMVAKVKFEVQLIPKLDLEAYKKQLVGASVAEARALVETFPNYKDGRAIVTPPIPILSQRLPFSADRIEIIVETVR